MKKQNLLLSLCLWSCLGGPTTLEAQNTAIPYQGRLTENNIPANGQYRMRFRLFADAMTEVGPTFATTTQSVSVVNGLFTARPEFIDNPDLFDGGERWLEIGIAAIDNPDLFTALVPRQKITPTPYAIYAATAGGLAGGVPLNFTSPVMFNATSGPPFSVASSTMVPGLNVDLLDGLDSSAFWKLTGNSGTTAGANFLGTTDNRALELKVNNTRALRLEPGGGWPNLIGGYSGNVVSNGVSGATISGGGIPGSENRIGQNLATVGGGSGNTSSGYAATVGGGDGNLGSGFAATVSGGKSNTSSGTYAALSGGYGNSSSSSYTTVSGGSSNTSSGDFATVGGGKLNTSSGSRATVGGGSGNTSTGDDATVGGGNSNYAPGNYATVPGGSGNRATASYTFAAGRLAGAINAGAFVWADSQPADFSSTASNQFLIRAAGGVGIGLNEPTSPLHVASAGNTPQLQITQTTANNFARLRMNVAGSSFWEMDVSSGPAPELSFWNNGGKRMALDSLGNACATSFNPCSDRNLKEGFATVNPREVLDKVAGLAISRWNFKGDTARPHVGPMAQDFHAAFGLGTDDKHIATVDADGVALAAIQGLNQKLEARSGELEARSRRLEAENAKLKQQNDEMESRLSALEKLINHRSAAQGGAR